MIDPDIDNIILKFVKNPESMTPSDFEKIDKAEHYALGYLKTMKRDVETQFVASSARIADMRARCEEARREGEEVSVQVELADGSDPQWVLRPPKEAFDIFVAREARWKLRNMKFLSCIELTINHFRKPATTSV